MPAKIVVVLGDCRASESPTRFRCQVVGVGTARPGRCAPYSGLGAFLVWGGRNALL